MTHNENSDDPWLQTAAKCLKVQISNSDMWAADTLFLSKENPFLNEEVSSQSAEK